MPYATYVATASVISLHTLNATYTQRFRLQRADKLNEILKNEQRSLAGVKQTLYFGKVTRWDIKVDLIPAVECALFEEFLDSTADGQIFTFDPYGSPEAPGLTMLCDREDNGFTMNRMTITGDPLYSDHFEYSFQLNQRA